MVAADLGPFARGVPPVVEEAAPPPFLAGVVTPKRSPRLHKSRVLHPVAVVWAYMEHNRSGDVLPKPTEAVNALVEYGVATATARTQVAAYRAWHSAGREGPTPRAFRRPEGAK